MIGDRYKDLQEGTYGASDNPTAWGDLSKGQQSELQWMEQADVLAGFGAERFNQVGQELGLTPEIRKNPEESQK